MSRTAFQKIYERGLENSRLIQKKKKEKELQEELEAEEEEGELTFGLPEPKPSAPIVMGGEAALLAILINEAAENIEMQIEAHKAFVGENHRDAFKPIGEGSTKDGSEVYSGRIVGANSVFVALSHGKIIEVHRLAHLLPNMKYNGKDPWHCPSQILANGNVMNIKYKGGVASIAHVKEKRQELQQEIVRTKEISR